MLPEFYTRAIFNHPHNYALPSLLSCTLTHAHSFTRTRAHIYAHWELSFSPLFLYLFTFPFFSSAPRRTALPGARPSPTLSFAFFLFRVPRSLPPSSSSRLKSRILARARALPPLRYPLPPRSSARARRHEGNIRKN